MIDFEIIVAVPGLTVAMPDLNKAHASLDKASRDENLARLRSFAVHFADVLWFAADIECVGRIHLHAIGKFERLNTGFKLCFMLPFRGVALVQFVEQVKLRALFGHRTIIVPNMLDEPVHLRVLRVDVGPLVHARQESRLPVLRFLNWITTGAHGDEARQILIICPKSVGHP